MNRTAALVASLLASVTMPATAVDEYKDEYPYRGGRCKVEEKSECRYPDGAGIAAAPRTMPPGFGTPQSVAPVISDGRCNREQIGRVIGGAAGAAIGSQIGDGTERKIAIVGGAVIGAIIGGRIGRSMDEADQACVGQALEHGRTGHTVAWDSADGSRFAVTPTRNYRGDQGERCREYVAGTEQQKSRGAACRQADGAWRPAAR